jgi:hypothetical protein
MITESMRLSPWVLTVIVTALLLSISCIDPLCFRFVIELDFRWLLSRD